MMLFPIDKVKHHYDATSQKDGADALVNELLNLYKPTNLSVFTLINANDGTKYYGCMMDVVSKRTTTWSNIATPLSIFPHHHDIDSIFCHERYMNPFYNLHSVDDDLDQRLRWSKLMYSKNENSPWHALIDQIREYSSILGLTPPSMDPYKNTYSYLFEQMEKVKDAGKSTDVANAWSYGGNDYYGMKYRDFVANGPPIDLVRQQQESWKSRIDRFLRSRFRG